MNKSPLMFESDEDSLLNGVNELEDKETNDRSDLITTVNGKENKILKSLQTVLMGIPPPPAFTVPQLDAREILKLWRDNQNYRVVLSPGKVVKSKTNAELKEMEVKNANWPEVLKSEHPDIYYNTSASSEEVARLSARYKERYVGAETSSSVNALFAKSPSRTASARKRARNRAWGHSPGRRLSHLARRRKAFSSASLFSVAGNSNPDKKMIMVEIKKIGNRQKKKNSVKKTKPTPKKAKSSEDASYKRALFQSPDQMPGKRNAQTPNTQGIHRSKRNLFIESSGEKEINENGKRERPIVRRVSPRKRVNRSLSFQDSGPIFHQPTSSSVIQNALTGAHKQKMLWAATNALRDERMGMHHELFRPCMSVLFKACQKLWLTKMLFNQEGSTSENMLKLAKRFSKYTIKEISSDPTSNHMALVCSNIVKMGEKALDCVESKEPSGAPKVKCLKLISEAAEDVMIENDSFENLHDAVCSINNVKKRHPRLNTPVINSPCRKNTPKKSFVNIETVLQLENQDSNHRIVISKLDTTEFKSPVTRSKSAFLKNTPIKPGLFNSLCTSSTSIEDQDVVDVGCSVNVSLNKGHRRLETPEVKNSPCRKNTPKKLFVSNNETALQSENQDSNEKNYVNERVLDNKLDVTEFKSPVTRSKSAFLKNTPEKPELSNSLCISSSRAENQNFADLGCSVNNNSQEGHVRLQTPVKSSPYHINTPKKSFVSDNETVLQSESQEYKETLFVEGIIIENKLDATAFTSPVTRSKSRFLKNTPMKSELTNSAGERRGDDQDIAHSGCTVNNLNNGNLQLKTPVKSCSGHISSPKKSFASQNKAVLQPENQDSKENVCLEEKIIESKPDSPGFKSPVTRLKSTSIKNTPTKPSPTIFTSGTAAEGRGNLNNSSFKGEKQDFLGLTSPEMQIKISFNTIKLPKKNCLTVSPDKKGVNPVEMGTKTENFSPLTKLGTSHGSLPRKPETNSSDTISLSINKFDLMSNSETCEAFVTSTDSSSCLTRSRKLCISKHSSAISTHLKSKLLEFPKQEETTLLENNLNPHIPISHCDKLGSKRTRRNTPKKLHSKSDLMTDSETLESLKINSLQEETQVESQENRSDPTLLSRSKGNHSLGYIQQTQSHYSFDSDQGIVTSHTDTEETKQLPTKENSPGVVPQATKSRKKSRSKSRSTERSNRNSSSKIKPLAKKSGSPDIISPTSRSSIASQRKSVESNPISCSLEVVQSDNVERSKALISHTTTRKANNSKNGHTKQHLFNSSVSLVSSKTKQKRLKETQADEKTVNPEPDLIPTSRLVDTVKSRDTPQKTSASDFNITSAPRSEQYETKNVEEREQLKTKDSPVCISSRLRLRRFSSNSNDAPTNASRLLQCDTAIIVKETELLGKKMDSPVFICDSAMNVKETEQIGRSNMDSPDFISPRSRLRSFVHSKATPSSASRTTNEGSEVTSSTISSILKKTPTKPKQRVKKFKSSMLSETRLKISKVFAESPLKSSVGGIDRIVDLNEAPNRRKTPSKVRFHLDDSASVAPITNCRISVDEENNSPSKFDVPSKSPEYSFPTTRSRSASLNSENSSTSCSNKSAFLNRLDHYEINSENSSISNSQSSKKSRRKSLSQDIISLNQSDTSNLSGAHTDGSFSEKSDQLADYTDVECETNKENLGSEKVFDFAKNLARPVFNQRHLLPMENNIALNSHLYSHTSNDLDPANLPGVCLVPPTLTAHWEEHSGDTSESECPPSLTPHWEQSPCNNTSLPDSIMEHWQTSSNKTTSNKIMFDYEDESYVVNLGSDDDTTASSVCAPFEFPPLIEDSRSSFPCVFRQDSRDIFN